MYTRKKVIRALMHVRFKQLAEEFKEPQEGRAAMNRWERRASAAGALRRDGRSHRGKTADANQAQFRDHWSMMLGRPIPWGVDRQYLRRQAFG